MRDERFDLMDNAQLNFEDITGFSGRSIFNICWRCFNLLTFNNFSDTHYVPVLEIKLRQVVQSSSITNFLFC
jgi:hypothetical protein